MGSFPRRSRLGLWARPVTRQERVPPALIHPRPVAADAAATAGFEPLYRANMAAVTAYLARRSADPYVDADLTADTFVAVITGFDSFDPRKGSARAWVFGVARRLYPVARCGSSRPRSIRSRPGRRSLSARPRRRQWHRAHLLPGRTHPGFSGRRRARCGSPGRSGGLREQLPRVCVPWPARG
jgi:hypothetical protein